MTGLVPALLNRVARDRLGPPTIIVRVGVVYEVGALAMLTQRIRHLSVRCDTETVQDPHI